MMYYTLYTSSLSLWLYDKLISIEVASLNLIYALDNNTVLTGKENRNRWILFEKIEMSPN